MQKPLILVTNDDGIEAPGIFSLVEALSPHAELVVVAPQNEQSAVGLSITIRQPLKIHKRIMFGVESYAVSGTPADCVKMALSVILKRKPNLIVSGINKGSNAGRNILYSGTVSAVIEGSLREVPGVAFSCYDYVDPDYSLAQSQIPSVVSYVLDHPLPDGTLLNVNFPSKKHGPYKGIKMARQGKQYWMEDPSHRSHPTEGESYWWLGAKMSAYVEHTESDTQLLDQGWVTAVPVFVAELTHHETLNERKSHFEDYFLKS